VGRDLIRLTSNLEMGIGNMGIFLCRPVSGFPAGPSNWGDSFEVYAGKQGFIQYDPQTLVGTDVFHIYPTPTRLYKELGGTFVQVQEPFSALLQAINPYQAAVALTTVSEDTIFYSFQNVTLSGTGTYTLEADIAVAANETFELERGEVYISYNTAAFGSNIVGSGNLTVSKGLVFNGNAYTLVVSDAAPDLVHIECYYSGSVGRSDINEVSQQLVHVTVDVTNLLMNPEIEFEAPDMQGESEFYDGSTSQLFDVVEVSDGIPALTMTSPVIDNIVALDASGEIVAGDPSNGLKSVITIEGQNFGTQGANSTVFFRNADFAPGLFGPQLQMSPVAGDIISWSDTEITVQVPSRNVPNGSGQTNQTAGTGWIGMRNDNGDVMYTSADPTSPGITVNYALTNFFVDNPADLSYLPFPVHAVLVDDANDGVSDGVGFQYSDGNSLTYNGLTFFDNSNARAAFERALRTWRCNTFVNFEVTPDPHPLGANLGDGVNSISFEPLASGVVKQAVTRVRTDECALNSPPLIFFGQLVDIDIIFSSSPSLPYHFGISSLPAGQIDFESLALHEIGHAHGLEHTTTSITEVMYPLYDPAQLANGLHRDLLTNDLDGGNRMMVLSTSLQTGCAAPLDFYSGIDCETNHISEENVRSLFNVFPSPATEKLTLQFLLNTKPLSYRVSLYDATGKLVSRVDDALTFTAGQSSIELDIRTYPPGLYTVTVEADDAMYSQKVILE